MALRTNKSIFYHIPKTGGIWVRKVIDKIGINGIETKDFKLHPLGLRKKHTTPDFTKEEEKKDLFSFTFIRHPVEWYKSFWNFRMDREGGPMIRQANIYKKFILDSCWSYNFDKFIDNVIERVPEGFLTKLYQYYIGEKKDKINFIGKTENLNEDLIKALTLAGEKINEDILEIIRNYGRINTSPDRIGEIKKETKNKILKTEYWIINNFYGITNK